MFPKDTNIVVKMTVFIIVYKSHTHLYRRAKCFSELRYKYKEKAVVTQNDISLLASEFPCLSTVSASMSDVFSLIYGNPTRRHNKNRPIGKWILLLYKPIKNGGLVFSIGTKFSKLKHRKKK